MSNDKGDNTREAIKETVVSIRRMSRAVYLESRRMAKRCGLTRTQSLLISTLASEGLASLSQLSRTLYVTPGNVTSVVDKLEEKGLVERVAKQGDRRVRLVKLTDEGLQASRALPDPIEEKLIRGLKDLRAYEVLNICTAFRHVVELIDASDTDQAPLNVDSTSRPPA
jgi:DNA-binding MarR family transcriptional regulator